MILTDTINPIEATGLEGAKTFGMQQSKKAFKILSGLYSDIHLAIVRELGCNAADAHKSVGKENVPFNIHLPNSLEPWLTIEDFGSGINHSDIYNVYAVYFASTKTNTNSQIGCMGLGSKSPFAYTDTFTVQSTVNGERRIYNAFFDEKGMPSIALMSTENVKESNGMKIQIPVKVEDFQKFINSVKKAFRFFDVRPNITGGTIAWDDETPTFIGDSWRSYESFDFQECFAIMGGVAYPVDVKKLDSKYHNFVNHTGLVMFFNMGELDFTPSRESLEYGEQTINALNAKVAFIEENFAEKYNENIQNKPNILEALKAVFISERKFSFMSQASQKKAAVWNGIDISMPETFCRKLLPSGVTAIRYYSYGRSKFRISNQFTLSNEYDWYVDDLQRGTEARAKQFIKNNTNKSIMIFSQSDVATLIATGFPDIFIKTSTLPKVEYNRNTSGTVKQTGFKIYKADGYRSWRESWDSEDYDPNNVPAYYIVKDGNSFDINLSTDKIICTEKAHIKSICKYLDIGIDDVCMVGKRGEATLIADGSKSFKELIENMKIDIDPVALATYQNGESIYYIREIIKDENYKKLSDTHPFKTFVETIASLEKKIKKFDMISNIIKIDKTKTSNQSVDPVIFKSDDMILNLLCADISKYSWDYKNKLSIMVELEKREKEMLTLKEKCEKL